jgi:hypothetical protein
MQADTLDQSTLNKLLAAQKSEITEYHIYKRLAAAEKDAANSRVLDEISKDELKHYAIWKSHTHRDVRPSGWKVRLYLLISRVFGITFSIKVMERGEEQAQVNYADIAMTVPPAKAIGLAEDRHEAELISMLDEDRLKYTGAIIRV